jgi:MinD-like ATPase involved in chromosome partitioning or flagellar assembly
VTNRFRKIIIGVVTFMWAINYGAPLVEKNYSPRPEINLAFMGVVGMVAASFERQRDEEDPPPKKQAKPKPRKSTKSGGK